MVAAAKNRLTFACTLWGTTRKPPILFRFAHHNRPSWKQGGKRSQSGSRCCVPIRSDSPNLAECSSPWVVCYPSVGSSGGMKTMKRREFITLLGGAAAWPLGARAQQPDQVAAIGMLIGYAEDDPETQARLAAFREGLGQLGWIEGHNVRIDYRFAPAGLGLAQAQLFAKELIALRPNVLVGNSTPASVALSRETRTIPIVFVGVSDPVGGGLVASSGNTTGFTNFEPSITGKWLELLKEIAPGIVRVAVIFNPKRGERFLLGPLSQ